MKKGKLTILFNFHPADKSDPTSEDSVEIDEIHLDGKRLPIHVELNILSETNKTLNKLVTHLD